MASMTVTVCLDWFYRACFNRHEELKLWLFKQAKQLQEEVAQSRMSVSYKCDPFFVLVIQLLLG